MRKSQLMRSSFTFFLNNFMLLISCGCFYSHFS
jgi:hypothetical protein